MPAKKLITKEEIISAAVDIVRKDGITALNMRTLAARCKCSTQPIYLSFENAEDLKKHTAIAILNLFDKCMKNEIAKGKYPEYKAVGMGYIRFAREEKELFKFLMMNDGKNKTGMEKDSFAQSVSIIMKNYGLYETDASKLHLQMWMFVHGIASMYATEYVDWDEDTVSLMLTDAYLGFSSKLKGDNK